MAAQVPRFQLWLWGKKKEEVTTSEDDDSSSDWGYGKKNPESVNMAAVSARRRMRKKREEMRVDREHDIVVIPSDGGCLSGSESDSDWSIGWLEPHSSDFLSEDDMVMEEDDSFAVLVPCYRVNSKGSPVQPSKNQLFLTPNNYLTDNKNIHGAVAYFHS